MTELVRTGLRLVSESEMLGVKRRQVDRFTLNGTRPHTIFSGLLVAIRYQTTTMVMQKTTHTKLTETAHTISNYPWVVRTGALLGLHNRTSVPDTMARYR